MGTGLLLRVKLQARPREGPQGGPREGPREEPRVGLREGLREGPRVLGPGRQLTTTGGMSLLVVRLTVTERYFNF